MKLGMSLYKQLPLDLQREIAQRVMIGVDRAIYEEIHKKEQDRCMRHLQAIIRNCTIHYCNPPIRISNVIANILSYDPHGVYRLGYLLSRIVTYIRKDPDMLDRFNNTFPDSQILKDSTKKQQLCQVYNFLCYNIYSADGGQNIHAKITNNFFLSNINE